MKNVLILTYWSYKDALIQTYTLPYVRYINKYLSSKSKVYLLTIENPFYKMSDNEWAKEKTKLEQENIILLRFKYSNFGYKMILRFSYIFLSLIKLIFTRNITHLHGWGMPGGAIGYILSIITGKTLIIDSYEPHAEPSVENGDWNTNSKAFKILFWLEKKMSKRTQTVIALTQGMRNYAKEKYNTTFQNYYIKPSLVDLNKFSFEQIGDKPNKYREHIVGLYAGKFGGIYLEKEVFDLFKVAYNYWGEKLKILILSNTPKEEILEFANRVEIPNHIFEVLFVNYSEIEQYFKLADFAINPVKPVPSKRFCTSIKDGEYWAMGLPVIITKNISDDSDIIENEDIGYVLKELNNQEYLNAIEKIDNLIKKDRHLLRVKIRDIAIKYRSFTIAEKVYKDIYKE